MGVMYDREETENTITIRWSRYLWVTIAQVVLVLLLVFVVQNSLISILGFIFIAAEAFLDAHRIQPDIAAGRQANAITTSGSRLSFTNPYTMHIDKTKLARREEK